MSSSSKSDSPSSSSLPPAGESSGAAVPVLARTLQGAASDASATAPTSSARDSVVQLPRTTAEASGASMVVAEEPSGRLTREYEARMSMNESPLHRMESNATSPFKYTVPIFLGLALRSLGIVYGDIGTSPLYVISTTFGSTQPTPADLIGALSLVVWSLLLMVSVKYSIFVLMVDNNGEGGTYALTALLTSPNCFLSRRGKIVASIFGLFGSALLLADGALTPAISVVSAIEGLAVADAKLFDWSWLIAGGILLVLFLCQPFGTSKVGLVFGPIILIWFLSLGTIGLYWITVEPAILRAFNPWEGIRYFRHEPSTFYQMGAVFLAITGVEALYADLGHLHAGPIRLSWFCVALPGLLLNYLGQGAMLIHDPALINNPFFNTVQVILGGHLFWPLFVIATLATIIASQAIITGSFSIASQAVSMGYMPPLTIRHTSARITGQIYVPEINFLLMIMTLAIVAGFKHSANIASAYGVTLSTVMGMTTVMFVSVLHFRYRVAWWKWVWFLLFVPIDWLFMATNYTKVPDGGWVALLIAVILFIIMFSWWYGQLVLQQTVRRQTLSTKSFKEKASAGEIFSRSSSSEQRRTISLTLDGGQTKYDLERGVPGTGVFLSFARKTVPKAFDAFTKKLRTIPERVIFLTVELAEAPFVRPEERVRIKPYGSVFYRVIVQYGFMEGRLDLRDVLAEAYRQGLPGSERDLVTYFVSRYSVHVTNRRFILVRLPLYVYRVLKQVFAGTPYNVRLSPADTLDVGVHVEL